MHAIPSLLTTLQATGQHTGKPLRIPGSEMPKVAAPTCCPWLSCLCLALHAWLAVTWYECQLLWERYTVLSLLVGGPQSEEIYPARGFIEG